MGKQLKFISWNVNGVRAALKKGLMDFLVKESPDVICFQEVKALPEQVDEDWPSEYYQYWYPAEKKGYSGTAIFSKVEPISVTRGMGMEEHDQEGRVITVEFSNYFLVNVYTPNSKRELERLDYRTKTWEVLFLKHLKTLEKKKPVFFCGDLNVAHKEIDLANPKTNVRNAGFTIEERQCFDRLIESGFIDTFREFEKGSGHYSWWSYRSGARDRNIGWRLDYWCLSKVLRSRLKKAWIMPEVIGSDHCPVAILIE
jgi:exodeoxyribonuclease-3